jgi:hypothetical protein
MINLVKQPYEPLPLLSISAEAEDRRNELAQSAIAIMAITTADDNARARNVAVEMRQFLKEVAWARMSLSRPPNDALGRLRALEIEHCAPIIVQLERLERLATVWLVEEQARAKAEEKARLDLAAEAKTDQEFAAVMAEPIQEEQRARGQQLRRVLRWEVTDINALVKSRPDLCKIEPKASAIQAVCVPEMPNLPPGLTLWWEEKATFTTR